MIMNLYICMHVYVCIYYAYCELNISKLYKKYVYLRLKIKYIMEFTNNFKNVVK